MWKEVLETYRCLVSAKKNMPGLRIEDLFGSCSLADLQKEEAFLKEKAAEGGYEEIHLKGRVELTSQKTKDGTFYTLKERGKVVCESYDLKQINAHLDSMKEEDDAYAG